MAYLVVIKLLPVLEDEEDFLLMAEMVQMLFQEENLI